MAISEEAPSLQEALAQAIRQLQELGAHVKSLEARLEKQEQSQRSREALPRCVLAAACLWGACKLF